MGQLECSSNFPVEKLDKKPTNSCSLFKNDENFHSFFKTVFSSKRFYRYKEWSFDRLAKIFLAQLLEMIRKSPQKLHKLFKKIFFKMFLLRGRKQLESPAYFFRQPAELFPLDFQKTLVCKFSKRFSPEKFHWNWESTFWQLRYIFLRKLVKNIGQSPKRRKKIGTKLLIGKKVPWTIRMQF